MVALIVRLRQRYSLRRREWAGAGGAGDDVPTIARAFVDFTASVANLALSSWAYTLGSSTKLQAQVYETNTSLGIDYARVPVSGLAQEAKSTALDVVNVAINVMPAGQAGVGRALEQAAGKVAAAEVVQTGQRALSGAAKQSFDASTGRMVGALRDAAKGKGNFGVGQLSQSEAKKVGEAWVGSNPRPFNGGQGLISQDGTRQYRAATAKSSPHATTGTQANLQSRNPVMSDNIDVKAQKAWQNNGHIDVK